MFDSVYTVISELCQRVFIRALAGTRGPPVEIWDRRTCMAYNSICATLATA